MDRISPPMLYMLGRLRQEFERDNEYVITLDADGDEIKKDIRPWSALLWFVKTFVVYYNLRRLDLLVPPGKFREAVTRVVRLIKEERKIMADNG